MDNKLLKYSKFENLKAVVFNLLGLWQMTYKAVSGWGFLSQMSMSC